MINLIVLLSLTIPLNSHALSEKVILGSAFNNSIQGILQETDFNSDLAISGEGFFPIRSKNGEIFYTRQGSIAINDQNHLIHKLSGYELMTLNKEGALVPLDLNGKSRKLFIGDPNRLATLLGWYLSDDGEFEGLYSDGTKQSLSKLTLAAFQNKRKLRVINRTKHILKYSKSVGEVAYSYSAREGMGKVFSKNLEQLNDDFYKKNFD